MSSYFNQSSDESDGGGETEQAVRQRIAKEFRYADEGGVAKGEGSEEEEEDGDPLEAFMAGLEVRVWNRGDGLFIPDSCSTTNPGAPPSP